VITAQLDLTRRSRIGYTLLEGSSPESNRVILFSILSGLS
jgi:hypothetical protein